LHRWCRYSDQAPGGSPLYVQVHLQSDTDVRWSGLTGPLRPLWPLSPPPCHRISERHHGCSGHTSHRPTRLVTSTDRHALRRHLRHILTDPWRILIGHNSMLQARAIRTPRLMANLPMRGDVTNEYDPKSDTSLGTYEPCDSSQVGMGLPELVIPTAQRRRKRQASYPPPLRRPGTSSHPLGGGCLTSSSFIVGCLEVLVVYCALIMKFGVTIKRDRTSGEDVAKSVVSHANTTCQNNVGRIDMMRSSPNASAIFTIPFQALCPRV
jgi:hypothetical protein